MRNDNIEKIEKLADDRLGDAIWIWYSADQSDRLFDRFITEKYSSPTIALITKGFTCLIVSQLEADIDFGMETRVSSEKTGIFDILGSELAKLNWPSVIFMNFSKSGDHKVDSLGHGSYLMLRKRIQRLYDKAGSVRPKIQSAEELFYALSERRSVLQISRMELAAERAQSILKSSFAQIREGMSEIEIADLIHRETERSRDEFVEQHGIAMEDYSWSKEFCPIVLVGPNLQKGGHAETSDYRIGRGETIYADFGVKHVYEDGAMVSSDLQRMAYLPELGEQEAPTEVRKVFDTLVDSIGAGISNIQPGMRGFEVDAIVRGIVTGAGYPNYEHSTGHPIGEVAHNPGTLLGPRDNPRARREIQANGTYTIEPRIQVPNGGSIEEMVVVTEQGARTLCDAQKRLWIVGKNI